MKKKIFKSRLLIFLISAILSASAIAEESLNQSCVNQQCSDLARIWGYVLGALGASVGPHLIVNKDSYLGGGEAGISVGSDSSKEVRFRLESFIGESEIWHLQTRTEIQLLGPQMPARLTYGLGVGQKFKLDLDHRFNWSAGPFFEKFERESRTRFGGYLENRILHRWNDDHFAVLDLEYSMTSEATYRLGIGHFFRTDSSTEGYLVEASYLHINALNENYWLLGALLTF